VDLSTPLELIIFATSSRWHLRPFVLGSYPEGMGPRHIKIMCRLMRSTTICETRELHRRSIAVAPPLLQICARIRSQAPRRAASAISWHCSEKRDRNAACSVCSVHGPTNACTDQADVCRPVTDTGKPRIGPLGLLAVSAVLCHGTFT